MKPERKPYDKKSPEAKALTERIRHGAFMREGTMVAFPLCFPGATVPIVAEESHVTALGVDASGCIYGGTSGRLTHLFVGMFHGVTGLVFDMGTVAGATHCRAVCCGLKKFVACVNGLTGGRLISRELEPLPFDLIQEWGFSRRPFEDLGEVVPGESIIHAVIDQSRRTVTGITSGHLFTLDIESGKVRTVGEVPGRGRVAIGSDGTVFGLDDGGALWRYGSVTGAVERNAVTLPKEGSWKCGTMPCARDQHSGTLYLADDEGRLFSFREREGFRGPLGKTPLQPVGPMAVTFDGRLFGTCGAEVSHLFLYHPARGEVRDLGVAVSVIERRRYGYVFGDAAVGRDGEIVFGEDDDLGHLWLYFPRVDAANVSCKS